MMRPLYYATNSALHRLNPLSKVIALAPLLIILALVTDLWIPLALIMFHITLLLAFAHIPLGSLARVSLPLTFTLVGFLIFYVPFVGKDISAGSPVLATIGPLHFSQAAILFGLATCLRLLAFYIVMLAFTLTTEATDLVRALVQQWHVNYRVGYAVMIVYQFIPLLEQEVKLIRNAQKVRGVTTRRGFWAEVERTRRTFLPLLGGAIRTAERKALTMDARAFGAFPTRTYYRQMAFKRRDWVFPLLYWLACAVIIVTLSR